jgi:uncharacterized membrane protein YoaK (UPF0700 family)
MPAGVSVAHAASAESANGSASHSVAAPEVALAAATSDLKLVFAKVGSDPGVGAALANAGQQLEILALPKNLADTVAANGAGGLPGSIVDAGRQAAANMLEAASQASLLQVAPLQSLQDNIVARALQGLAAIALFLPSNSFPPLPPGFVAADYTSFFKVAQNLVNVAVLPLAVGNLLLTGQFDQIAPKITTTLNTAFTSVTQGLPTSILQTANWVLTGQPPAAPTMTAAAATVDSLTANQASTLQATPAQSLQDNVLARGLQGLADIALFLPSNSFPPLAPGFVAADYTSFLKVAQNLVNVAVLPLAVGNLVLTGQFDQIAPKITTTVNTAFTSVTQGLPTSIAQTANWVVTGNPPAATTATATENSLLKASVVGAAPKQDALDKVDGGTPDDGTTSSDGTTKTGSTTNGSGDTKPGGIIRGILNGGGDTTDGGTTNGGANTKPGGVLSGVLKGGGNTKPGGVPSAGGITKDSSATTNTSANNQGSGSNQGSGTGSSDAGAGKHAHTSSK